MQQNYNSDYQADRLPMPGDHVTVAIGVASVASVDLEPGYYSLEAEGAACHVAAGVAPVADTTCLWIANGGGRYQRLNSVMQIATIQAGAATGTLHINRVG